MGEENGKYDLEAKYAGNDKYDTCTAKVTITINDDAPDNEVTQNSSSAVTSTDKYHENKADSHEGCRFLGQYELWVRNSDDVVVQAPGGNGIGLTLTQWMAKFGPASTEPQPAPTPNKTNAIT